LARRRFEARSVTSVWTGRPQPRSWLRSGSSGPKASRRLIPCCAPCRTTLTPNGCSESKARKSGSHLTPRWREMAAKGSAGRCQSGRRHDQWNDLRSGPRWRGSTWGALPWPFRSRRDRWFESGSLHRRVSCKTGPDAVYYATRLRGASHEKARRELEFRPRPLEWI
jgi:hypothetical protein